MRGLVFHGVQQVEYRTDLPDPQLQVDQDVIVKNRRVGICGSDLHQYLGREGLAAGTILGHEFSGEIVAVGPGVKHWKQGDHVFSPFTTSCGACFYCRNRLSARCPSGQLFGYQPPAGVPDTGSGLSGAQADYVRVPLADSTLLAKPPSMSWDEAILLGDNFTTGYYCCDMAGVEPGQSIVVLGCGSVGLSALVSAIFRGADSVVAVDGVAARRQAALALGATMAVAPDEALEVSRDLAADAGRLGFDAVLEAVGSPAAQALAFDLVRPGGVISAVGVHSSSQFSFSPMQAYDHNLTYRAGRCPVRSYLDEVIEAVENRGLTIPTALIVTQSDLPLHAGPDAYRRFSNREDNIVKLLLNTES